MIYLTSDFVKNFSSREGFVRLYFSRVKLLYTCISTLIHVHLYVYTRKSLIF